jgi:hypothetical protein
VPAVDGSGDHRDVAGQCRGAVRGRPDVVQPAPLRIGVDRGQRRLQHRDLAAEREVQRLHGDPGRLRDGRHRGVEVALLHEQPGGRDDDPLPGLLGAPGAGGAGALPRTAGIPVQFRTGLEPGLERLAVMPFHNGITARRYRVAIGRRADHR